MTAGQTRTHTPHLPVELTARGVETDRALYEVASAAMATRWAARAAEAEGADPSRTSVVGFGSSAGALWPRDVAQTRDWSRPRYLFVGRDWERKNGPRVLETFEQIRSSHPGAELHLVGNTPGVDARGVVDHGSLGYSERDRATLRELYRTATCYVMPSLLEAAGIVHAEAGAAGVGSAMEAFTDPDRARERGRAERAHSEQLTWEQVARRGNARAGGREPAGAVPVAGFPSRGAG